MGITRPTGEQLRFRSQNTGDHVLDTYLEASEKGGRALTDLLDDLFDSSGVFRAANFEFQFDPSVDKIQFRAGNFASPSAGWTDITTFFNITGTFNAATTYQNFDLATTSDKDVYIVHGLSSGTTFANEAAFIASSNTTRIVDVSEARDWAKKTDGIVDSTDYSSKAWAIGGTGVTNSATGGAAKEWAIKTSGTVDGTNYSAKYWATSTDVVTVSTNIADVTTVATDISNVNTVSTNISSVNTTSSNIADVNTVAAEIGVGQDVTVVAADLSGTDTIGTAATNIANINTTAGSIANVNTVAGSITNVNTVSGSITNVNTTATNIADVNTVATEINNNNLQTVAADIQAVIDVADDLNEATSEIDTVANSIANVDTVGTNITSVNTVSTNISNVNTVGTDISNVNTVATNLGAGNDVTVVAANIADVNTVAGISADVTTAATNSVAFNNTYLGAQSSAPTQDPDGSALDLGDLYFDTTTSTMKVYSTSGWINAGSSVNGTADRFTYTATASQTTFTGNDDNTNSLAYDAGFLDVYMNGVKLVNGSDFTATNGTSIVLASGAAANDTIEIIAYGTFVLADHLTETQSDAKYVQQTHTGDVSLNGNLGIGITGTPTQRVQIGAAQGRTFVIDQSTTNTTRLANDYSAILEAGGGYDLKLRADGNTSFGSILFETAGTTDRMKIAPNGDIAFYENTGSTPSFYWDSNEQRIGIGTTTPTSNIDIEDADEVRIDLNCTAGRVYRLRSTTANEFRLRDSTAAADRLVIGATGNVAVGTDTARENLTVKNTHISDSTSNSFLRHNMYWNGSALTVENSSYGTAQIGLNRGGGGHITFETGAVNTIASEKMRIGQNGNLGIGISNTALRKIHIEDAAAAGIRLDDTGGSAGGATNSFVEFFSGGTDVGYVGLKTGGGYMALANLYGPTTINTNNSAGTASQQNAIFYSSSNVFNESGEDLDFRIESDNNANMIFVDASIDSVGIGTTPDTQFHIANNSSCDVRVQGGSNSRAQIQYKNDAQQWNVGINGADNYVIYDSTNSFEAMTISATTGRSITINENSVDLDFRVESNNSNNALTVNAANDEVYFFANSLPIMGAASNQGVSIGNAGTAEIRCLNTTINPNIWLKKQGSDGAVLNFYRDSSSVGNVTITSSGTTYNTTSDRRLKTDIEPIEHATDMLMAMNPVSHRWKLDPDGDAVVGFIAQEMQEIVPEAVSGEPEGDEMMSMDYGRITPVLVAALQDAHKKIEALEERLAELEAK